MAAFATALFFAAVRKGAEIIARTRKDAVLCFKATAGPRRFYDQRSSPRTGAPRRFCPLDDHQDLLWRPATTCSLQGNPQRLLARWRPPTPLRLFVVAPTPYRKRKSSRFYYHQPAYLLTTDLKGHAKTLLQMYFDRWQIEVNHREEKDTIGVGQAQLWNVVSVPKQPVLAVASYSALLLASLLPTVLTAAPSTLPCPNGDATPKDLLASIS